MKAHNLKKSDRGQLKEIAEFTLNYYSHDYSDLKITKNGFVKYTDLDKVIKIHWFEFCVNSAVYAIDNACGTCCIDVAILNFAYVDNKIEYLYNIIKQI